MSSCIRVEREDSSHRAAPGLSSDTSLAVKPARSKQDWAQQRPVVQVFDSVILLRHWFPGPALPASSHAPLFEQEQAPTL